MRSVRWLLVLVCIATAWVADGERDASACGGCFTAPPPPSAPPESVDSVITTERMIFSISKEETTLFDEITYSGSPASFAWVLPIKGEVKVGLSADVLFATIDQLTASSVVGPQSNGCPPPPVCSSPSYGGAGCGCGSASLSFPSGAIEGTITGVPSSCSGANTYLVVAASDCAFANCAGSTAYALCDGSSYSECECDDPGSGWTAGGAGSGVTVNARKQVGPYETVQLHSNDGSALTGWLTSHGYRIPPADAAVIARYVADGMDFLALKLVPGEGVQAMQPVRVTTAGAFPVLPLRMVSVGTGATTGVTLWIVADGRWEPQNFPFFTIKDSELSWDWASSSSNYESLRRSKEAALQGAGWQIESSLELSQYSITNAVYNAISSLSAGVGGYAQPLGEGGVDDAGVNGSDAGVASDAENGEAGEAGVSVASEGGTGEDGGFGTVDGALDEEGGVSPSETAGAEADFEVLFAGMAKPNVRITRVRSDLAHSALGNDLVVEASADSSELSNKYHTTHETGQPPCPVYDSDCVVTGEAPRNVAQADASGGCSTLARRSMTSRSTLALIAAFVGLGVLRSRRRRRQR